MRMFCWSLFVLLSFSFGHCVFLSFFDLRILVQILLIVEYPTATVIVLYSNAISLSKCNVE